MDEKKKENKVHQDKNKRINTLIKTYRECV